jgi:hypothetical protein
MDTGFMDYSQDFLDLKKALTDYQNAMNTRRYADAFEIGLQLVIHARMLKIVAQDLAE